MKLELREVTIAAGSFRRGPISLEVGDGEYLIVLGPTGAGKTLTLETIAGLRPVGGGHILMDGSDVTGSAPESRRVGFLFQDSLLFPHLSVRRNIEYGAARRGRSGPLNSPGVNEIAAAVGVEGLLERMPRGLSGGERQRVALARALATGPVLLLLDEPMASLDPNSRRALRSTLLETHRKLGTTTIHVTHNFAEAAALGDRVAIMIEGRILQAGPTREVFARPASPVIAGFLRYATRSEKLPRPEPDALTISPRRLRLELIPDGGDSVRAQLSAERAIVTIGSAASEEADALAARVVSVESDGRQLTLKLNVGMDLKAKVGLSEPGAESLEEGASVWVRIPRQEL